VDSRRPAAGWADRSGRSWQFDYLLSSSKHQPLSKPYDERGVPGGGRARLRFRVIPLSVRQVDDFAG
jgi:hypothetical protein